MWNAEKKKEKRREDKALMMMTPLPPNDNENDNNVMGNEAISIRVTSLALIPPSYSLQLLFIVPYHIFFRALLLLLSCAWKSQPQWSLNWESRKKISLYIYSRLRTLHHYTYAQNQARELILLPLFLLISRFLASAWNASHKR